MNALVLFSPIPIPANPAALPSLPAWLQQRIAALASAVQPDSKGRYRTTPILPREMILSSSELALVQQHIDDLERFTRLDQPIELRGATLTNDQAHGAMIASLLLKGGAKLDQQSSDAFTEDYLDAIEDLPAWSVREAIRKWNRAESPRLDGKPHSYDFRPSPPTLRRLALHEMIALRGRLVELQKICDARELIEYSDEYRRGMLERLTDLFKPQLVPRETEDAT
ncbi:hypothetical protein ACVILK_004801 [Bradyrhizobium embrapense]